MGLSENSALVLQTFFPDSILHFSEFLSSLSSGVHIWSVVLSLVFFYCFLRFGGTFNPILSSSYDFNSLFQLLCCSSVARVSTEQAVRVKLGPLVSLRTVAPGVCLCLPLAQGAGPAHLCPLPNPEYFIFYTDILLLVRQCSEPHFDF